MSNLVKKGNRVVLRFIFISIVFLMSPHLKAAKDLESLEINPDINIAQLGWNAYFSENGLANAPMTIIEHSSHQGLRGFYTKEFRPLEESGESGQKSFLDKELKSYCKNLSKAYEFKKGQAKIENVHDKRICKVTFNEGEQKTIQYISARVNASMKSYTLDILTFAISHKKLGQYEKIVQNFVGELL